MVDTSKTTAMAKATTPITSADTKVASVTFFEDRAEVVRIARCSVPKGRSRVHAHGLTLLVDDRSLSCKPLKGGVNVIFSRVRRRVENVATASAEEVMAIEAELERARERIARAERALGRTSVEAGRLNAMIRQWCDALAHVPSRADVAIAELERAYDTLHVATGTSLDAFGRVRTEREDARMDQARVDMRLEQARSKKPRFEAFAEVEIVADADTDLELEIVYRTPCALWRPEHLARLTRKKTTTDTDAESDAGEISLTTYASVWQLTGESWKDVPCRFSTARPAQSAAAPMLREDVLTTRKKTDMERKHVIVEAREQTIAAAGIAGGTRDVDEMPGVDDGGEAQWFTGRSHATIESDGRPVRVEISERVFPCTLARVCYPEIGPPTHLRATATLPGPAPLLAGPVTIGRESEIVGRSSVGFVGAGEPFELGFGVDDGLRVRRRVNEKRKTTPVTNTQHIAREVCLYVSNLSGDTRSLKVIERVPISEVEDVQVEIERQPSNGPKVHHDSRDGFATFEVELAPRATRDLVLKYRIEARSNVVLPPLG